MTACFSTMTVIFIIIHFLSTILIPLLSYRLRSGVYIMQDDMAVEGDYNLQSLS